MHVLGGRPGIYEESCGSHLLREEEAVHAARRDGFGISRPRSRAASIQDAMASWTLVTASSGVSPSLMQPGRSGTVARKPPPSSGGRGSMTTGYSRRGIAAFR